MWFAFRSDFDWTPFESLWITVCTINYVFHFIKPLILQPNQSWNTFYTTLIQTGTHTPIFKRITVHFGCFHFNWLKSVQTNFILIAPTKLAATLWFMQFMWNQLLLIHSGIFLFFFLIADLNLNLLLFVCEYQYGGHVTSYRKINQFFSFWYCQSQFKTLWFRCEFTAYHFSAFVLRF